MSLFKKKDLTETTAEETDNPSVTATAVPVSIESEANMRLLAGSPSSQGSLREGDTPTAESTAAPLASLGEGGVTQGVTEGVPPSESDVALSGSDVAASSSDVVLADSDDALAGSEETAPVPPVVAHDDKVVPDVAAVPEGVPPSCNSSTDDTLTAEESLSPSLPCVKEGGPTQLVEGLSSPSPVLPVVVPDDSVPSAPIVAERPVELALSPSPAPAFDTVDDLTDAQLAAIHARVLHGEIIEM